MTEKLLQYIWQFRHFNFKDIRLENGDPLQILSPGQLNTAQGPDFLNARIRIGNTVWVGHVELHLQASGWLKHAHDSDPNYNSVILHVVWENDSGNTARNIPVLSLNNRVPKLLLQRYEEWMHEQHFIPCQNQLADALPLVWIQWKERLALQRLQRKLEGICVYLYQSKNHWEEIFWWLIARNFGLKINADAFESMAKTIPVALLARYKNRPITLEAFLFGQAGLLEKTFTDAYPLALQEEYRFLQSKFHCEPIPQNVHFLRMRPVNFPTIRLSQLAALASQSTHLFAAIRDNKDVQELKQWFNIRAGDYWNNHYIFDELSVASSKLLGNQTIENILINTVIPMVFAYGIMHGENETVEKALQWLQQIHPESNQITRNWNRLGISCSHASDSQALLELKSRYCDHKKCLECAIGNNLLKKIVQQAS